MPTDITKVVIPTLSPDGWVYSSDKQADYLMAYFLASDYSQSNIHVDQVSSFGYLVALYNSEPLTLVAEMSKALKTLFERYFNIVEVECTEVEQDNPSKFILRVFVEFVNADGVKSNIHKLTQITGSKFEIIRSLATDKNP